MLWRSSPKPYSFDLQPLSHHILRHAVPGHCTTPCSYLLDYLYDCGSCWLSHDLFRRAHCGLLILYLVCLFHPCYFGSVIACIIVRCILDWLNRFSRSTMYLRSSRPFIFFNVSYRGYRFHVSDLTDFLDIVKGTLKHYCLKSLLLVSFLVVRFKNILYKTS